MLLRSTIMLARGDNNTARIMLNRLANLRLLYSNRPPTPFPIVTDRFRQKRAGKKNRKHELRHRPARQRVQRLNDSRIILGSTDNRN
ncbi:hypothetical protein HZB90_04210 [archaeon]|nr:hypothetical protein [archaeon]